MAVIKEPTSGGGSRQKVVPPKTPASYWGSVPTPQPKVTPTISDRTRGSMPPPSPTELTTILPTTKLEGLKKEVQYKPILEQSGGGGGGGGGGVKPPETSGVVKYAGLPTGYTTAMTGILGDLTKYYTTERGGEDQARNDYNNILSFWYNRTGKPMMTEDVNKITAGFAGYAKLLGRTPVMGDYFTFLDKYLSKAPTPPQVSFSRVGEY